MYQFWFHEVGSLAPPPHPYLCVLAGKERGRKGEWGRGKRNLT